MIALVNKIIVSKVEETFEKGAWVRRLANLERTGNKYSQLTLYRLPPRHKSPKHLHPNSEQMAYVLRGQVLCKIGEEEVEVSAGEFVVIPEGTSHISINLWGEDVEILLFHAPIPKVKYLE